MKAVWYEQNGPAEVMQFGEMPDPEPGPGEVRVRVVSSRGQSLGLEAQGLG